jgi:hypothetical protein
VQISNYAVYRICYSIQARASILLNLRKKSGFEWWKNSENRTQNNGTSIEGLKNIPADLKATENLARNVNNMLTKYKIKAIKATIRQLGSWAKY